MHSDIVIPTDASYDQFRTNKHHIATSVHSMIRYHRHRHRLPQHTRINFYYQVHGWSRRQRFRMMLVFTWLLTVNHANNCTITFKETP